MSYFLQFITCFWLLTSISVQAQNNTSSHTNKDITTYLLEHKAKLIKSKIAVKPPYTTDYITQILQQQLPNLGNNTSLRLTQIAESPIGTHYSFVQTFNGFDIYDATVRLSLNKKGEIYLINDRTFDSNALAQIASPPQKQQSKASIKQFLENNNLTLNEPKTNKSNNTSTNIVLLFVNNSKAIWAYQLNAETPQHSQYHQYLIDLQGNELYKRDLISDNKTSTIHKHKTIPTTKPIKQNKPKQSFKKNNLSTTTESCQAYIFQPDPLTSSQSQYGTNGLIDNNDNDSPALNNERKAVTIEATLQNGIYSLENEYAKIIEYQSPAEAPVTSNTPYFNFTRSQSGFEDVNSYYHLAKFAQYILSIGFNMLKNEQILIDTHAENGEDQSTHRFDYNYDQHVISQGEGNIDDAEDADVVVHEFGHALSFGACNDCNSGAERSALDEAIGDYFAASYSYSLSNYKWKEIFSWDGHNPFFPGRDIDGSNHYPDDISSNKYITSIIFSSALAEILETIGKPAADSLVLTSLYDWSAGIGLDDAAEIMILADQELSNGRHYNQLCYIFSNRGLYDGSCSVEADAGNDQTICLGDTVILGGSVIPPIGGSILWTPASGLNSDSISHPICSPSRTTNYTLTVKNSTTTLSDEVKISVQYCFTDSIGSSIKIYNTDRFYTGGDAVVEVPSETQQVSLQLFDAAGRLVMRIDNTGNNRIAINSLSLRHGLYILRVQADEQQACFKMVKVKQ